MNGPLLVLIMAAAVGVIYIMHVTKTLDGFMKIVPFIFRGFKATAGN